MKSQLSIEQAALNSLMNRDPSDPLPVPDRLPAMRKIKFTDDELLSLATKQNPELSALKYDADAKNKSIQLAHLQYMPDFSASAGTDLAGITQSLSGMLTVPLFRYEAINAAIAQAEAKLKSTQAMRRQTRNDLAGEIIADITTLRDADRQLDLFQHAVLPRAQQAVNLTRSSYETGQSTFVEFLDSERPSSLSTG